MKFMGLTNPLTFFSNYAIYLVFSTKSCFPSDVSKHQSVAQKKEGFVISDDG